MSNESNQPQLPKVAKTPKTGPMPVLRLISRLCVGVVNGRLAAVPKLLTVPH